MGGLGGPATRDRRTPPSLRVAATVTAFDLRRRVRDRTAILMGIVTPLVMAAVIGLAFGGGFSFDATIAIVDLDGTDTSAALVDGLVSGVPDDAPVHLERRADEPTARADLGAGSVDAIIIVPDGFTEGLPAVVAGGAPGSLGVIMDADKRIAGDVATSIADGIAVRIGAAALAIATTLDAQDQPMDAAALDEVVRAGQQVDLPITLAQLDVGASYSPVAYFGASMGILFLFFTVGGAARSLITERRDGTLQRVRAAPVTDVAVLVGKAGAVLIVGFASLLTIWLVTTVAFGADWGEPAAVAAVLAATVFAVAGISALVAGVARTDAQADGITAVVAFVFALLGGSFFQPAGMPPVLQALSLLTPNGWALRAATRIGAGGAGVVDVLPTVGVLLAIGLITAAIGMRTIRTKVLA